MKAPLAVWRCALVWRSLGLCSLEQGEECPGLQCPGIAQCGAERMVECHVAQSRTGGVGQMLLDLGWGPFLSPVVVGSHPAYLTRQMARLSSTAHMWSGRHLLC